MESKYVFTTVYQPLNANISKSPVKVMDLPVGTVLIDESDTFGRGDYVPVVHKTNARAYKGYVKAKWVEPFNVHIKDRIAINTGTASINDAAQYIVYKEKVQYNLCGEFCVLYATGKYDLSIEDFLGKIDTQKPDLWNRLFYRGQARTTGISDLRAMIGVLTDRTDYISTVQESLYDMELMRTLMTPLRVADVLAYTRMIIGCNIETVFGRLRRSGVPHWVVLDEVLPESRGAVVRLYNPFSNSIEVYSWEELVASVKAPYGVVVPR